MRRQDVGALREPKSVPNDNILGGASVERCKLLLLIVLPINMHPYPTWRVGSSKLIAQDSREINEVGVAKVFSGHPSHGDLLTIPKHKSIKELVDQSDVVILLNLHERWWRGVDDVNDRPVGNPKRRCDEHSSKFSLSYETNV
jgi:hypothetical protein